MTITTDWNTLTWVRVDEAGGRQKKGRKNVPGVKGKHLGPLAREYVPVDKTLQVARERQETQRGVVEEYLLHLGRGQYYVVEDLAVDFEKSCHRSRIRGSKSSFYRWIKQFVLEKHPWFDFVSDGRRLHLAVRSRQKIASN